MIKYQVYLSIIGLFIILSACEKIELPDAVDEAMFGCRDGVETEYYFEGDLDGESFCYEVSGGMDEMYLYQTTRFLTSKPQLTLGDSATSVGTWATFKMGNSISWPSLIVHNMNIEGPIYAQGTPKESMLKEWLKEGSLPLRTDSDGFDGFNVMLSIIEKETINDTGGGNYFFNSKDGKQEDAYLEITELEKIDQNDKWLYKVTFEFACDLYYGPRHYARVDNAVFHMAFELDKDG